MGGHKTSIHNTEPSHEVSVPEAKTVPNPTNTSKDNATQQATVNELLALFNDWPSVYDACVAVWQVMRINQAFDVNVLLARMPFSFACFLTEALENFAEEEGITLPELILPA